MQTDLNKENNAIMTNGNLILSVNMYDYANG